VTDLRHEEIIDGLAEHGFAVLPGFLPRGAVTALREEGTRRRTAGEFQAATVGHFSTAPRDASVRGDSICWLGTRQESAPERALLRDIDALRHALNGALFLGVDTFEGHYAHYAPGAGYHRHLDRFRDDDARVISLVLYLNDMWIDADGGALRIYATRDTVEPVLALSPRGGTLVAMRSETMPHEVRPAQVERWSITGWLRQAPHARDGGRLTTSRSSPRLG
jgi:SM-20-related protein